MINTRIIRWIADHLSKAASKPDFSALAYRYHQGKLSPITISRDIELDDLVGIDHQKKAIVNNTRQFLHGFDANHVLLTGARGAGKSSLVRALLTHYANQGLRIIEVDKSHLPKLDQLAKLISKRPERFLIYCDDLSFTDDDDGYRMLKSSLDGSLASVGDNFIIYATSNRRHLLPQKMNTNTALYHAGDGEHEINPREQIDETTSLAERFGLWLSFHPMDQDTYLDIVRHIIAKNHPLESANTKITRDKNQSMDFKNIDQQALRWAHQRGGRSGRVAAQFARDYIGKVKLAQFDSQMNNQQ